MQQGRTSSSRLNRLLSFLERDANNVALRKDAIREACDTGHWDIARELIDAGLQAHPQHPALLALSGFALLQAQRYGDAERVLSAALALGLEEAGVRYNLAFARFMQKRHEEALELLTPPVSQALPLALLLRARCLHHLDRRDEAVVDCMAHLAAAPGDAETSGLLALLLYEQGESESARTLSEAALRQNPKQLEAMLASASMQSDAREYDAARASFDALLQAHPECGRAWLGLALIDLVNMRTEAAKHAIDLAAAHMPEHIGTWHVLAWIHILLGELAAAEAAFEKALALDRTFGDTHGGRAVIAALQGREVDARIGIKLALRLDPQSASARCAEMLLLQRQGRHDEAQAVLDAYLARPAAHGDMQYRELVALQMEHLRARAGKAPATVPDR